VKGLPKFASIVDREVTLPSNVPIDTNERPHRTRNATIVKKRDTLLLLAPIHGHVLLFHRQQRQHPITKEVLRQQSDHVMFQLWTGWSFCQSMPRPASTIDPNPRQPEYGTNSGLQEVLQLWTKESPC
jgi:hypothetical protein